MTKYVSSAYLTSLGVGRSQVRRVDDVRSMAQTGTLDDAGEYVGWFRDFSPELRAVHSAVKEIFDPVIHCIIGLHCIRQICLGDFVHQDAMSYRIECFREVESKDAHVVITGQLVSDAV